MLNDREEYLKRRRETTRKWRARNPEYAKEYNKQYTLKNPLVGKRATYMRAYPNATENDWQHYLNTTHCECCGIKFVDSRTKHQHHDHTTGKLIGVWCQSCNHAEGRLNVMSAYQVACSIAENTPLDELIRIAQGDNDANTQN